MWISLYYIVDIDVIDELIERDRQRRANIDLAIALQVTDYLGPGLGVGHYRVLVSPTGGVLATPCSR